MYHYQRLTLSSLRGPSPIHRAMLLCRPATGITIQTLSREAFDQGKILWQQPEPIQIEPHHTISTLTKELAEYSAARLSDFILSRNYEPPYKDRGWFSSAVEPTKLDFAPKITKADMLVDWQSWGADEILLRHRALPSLWDTALHPQAKRIVYKELKEVNVQEIDSLTEATFHPGQMVSLRMPSGQNRIIIATCDLPCRWIEIQQYTIEGCAVNTLDSAMKRMIRPVDVQV
jgi:methionyl-tRNA formyltransferase